MRAALTFTIVLSASSFASAQEQPIDLTPVKKELLDGTRLLLPTANASVDVPSADWKWMTFSLNSGQNYLCVNSKDHTQILVAVGHLHGDFTDHQPQSLLDNARKGMEARKGKLENDKFTWVDLPNAKKTARVTFVEVESTGQRNLIVIYLAQTFGEMNLKLQYRGPAKEEPEDIKKLSQSIKPIKAGDAPAKTDAPAPTPAAPTPVKTDAPK